MTIAEFEDWAGENWATVRQQLLPQDEFRMNANSGSNGNDWLNSEYDAKSKSFSDTIVGGWAYRSKRRH